LTSPTFTNHPPFTKYQRKQINDFLFGKALVACRALPDVRKAQSESYQSWILGGRGWDTMEQGGTGILIALTWYQHVHRPGSKEWRPKKIIAALLSSSEESRN